MQSKCCGWLCVILFPSKPSEGRRGKASVSPRGRGCLRKKDCGTGSALVSLSQEIFMPSIIQSSFLEKHYWLPKPRKEWQLFKKQTNKKKNPTYYWEVKLFTLPFTLHCLHYVSKMFHLEWLMQKCLCSCQLRTIFFRFLRSRNHLDVLATPLKSKRVDE